MEASEIRRVGNFGYSFLSSGWLVQLSERIAKVKFLRIFVNLGIFVILLFTFRRLDFALSIYLLIHIRVHMYKGLGDLIYSEFRQAKFVRTLLALIFQLLKYNGLDILV